MSGEDRAEAVAEKIRQCGVAAYTHQADVSQEEQVGELFRRMLDRFGTIDILINNAGVQRDAAFQDMTLEQWNTVLRINLTGQFLCAREAVKEFLRRGINPRVSCAAGKIICVSSVHELIPWARRGNSRLPKAG